jgi:HTH-type transcriptional regulator/antitoxin HigA
MTRRDFEAILGTCALDAEVLNRKRDFSIGMIRRLHERLVISADVLIRRIGKDAAWEASRRSDSGSCVSPKT